MWKLCCEGAKKMMISVLLITNLLLGRVQALPDKMWTGSAVGSSVRVISVDLKDPRVSVSVAVAKGSPYGVEPFHAFISRTKPTVCINGAYASKTDFRPVGDIVIKGKLVYSGLMGTAFCITKDKQVAVKRVIYGHASDWTPYETVLACGPALVLNGKVDVLPEFERFSDPHVMGATKRMGIGVTRDNHLLIVHTLSSVSFLQFGKIMLSLGCLDAMNLDAGASLGMYYRGNTLLTPSRHITNVFEVHVGTPAPDISLLYPQANSTSLPPASPPDPGNSNAKTAVAVSLCADSMGKASAYCPQTVKRRLPANKIPRPCPFHKRPPGE